MIKLNDLNKNKAFIDYYKISKEYFIRISFDSNNF